MADTQKKTSSDTQSSGAGDVEKNKVLAAIAYIGILWIVPLLAAKDSPFAMYHANQGLILFLLAIAVNMLGTLVPVIGWFILLPLGNLVVLIFAIMGILNTVAGQRKPLPWIGQSHLIG